MLRGCSLDLRERLIDAVEAGSSARAAARRLQLSASTAVKWVHRLCLDEPDLTLRQIGERLAADGIHVSKGYLHTFLWRNRIRLKKDRACRRAEPAGREEAA